MKNFKKIIASILVIVIMITAAPIGSITGLDFNLDWLDFSTKSAALDASGSCGENVTYTFNKNTGALIISGTGAMYYYSPFSNNSAIKTVVIKNGVTSIDDGAFYYCKNLTGITIPDSVMSIGDGAFGGCTGLTSITIPDSVTSIDYSAFAYCTSLKSITIPNSVTSIGDNMFDKCYSLCEIQIPEHLAEQLEAQLSTKDMNIKIISNKSFDSLDKLISDALEKSAKDMPFSDKAKAAVWDKIQSNIQRNDDAR